MTCRRTSQDGGACGDEEGDAVGIEGECEVVAVDVAVVEPAQAHEVREFVRATVAPIAHVMDIGPTCRPVTSGEATASIAGHHGTAVADRYRDFWCSDIERHTRRC